jgi:hypothetical protein
MTPKRSIDPAIVRNIHERAVKAALAALSVDLMADDRYRLYIEEQLQAGTTPESTERAVVVALADWLGIDLAPREVIGRVVKPGDAERERWQAAGACRPGGMR